MTPRRLNVYEKPSCNGDGAKGMGAISQTQWCESSHPVTTLVAHVSTAGTFFVAYFCVAVWLWGMLMEWVGTTTTTAVAGPGALEGGGGGFSWTSPFDVCKHAHDFRYFTLCQWLMPIEAAFTQWRLDVTGKLYTMNLAQLFHECVGSVHIVAGMVSAAWMPLGTYVVPMARVAWTPFRALGKAAWVQQTFWYRLFYNGVVAMLQSVGLALMFLVHRWTGDL